MVQSRRDAIAEARRLGITVETVRRSGEVRFISPFPDTPSVRLNNRRHDSTRAVEAMLRRHRPKEEPTVTIQAATPKPTPMDEARAFVRGRTTKEVIRAMAVEPKADPRLGILVERLDAQDARRAARAQDHSGDGSPDA